VTKRLRFIFVLLLVALLGWAGGSFFRVREPEYQGKKLSAWLGDLTLANTTSAQQQAAIEAVRSMGTNAIPALLAMLAAEDPRWRVQTVNWFQDTLHLSLRTSLANADRQRARLGFRVLGPTARPAIPELAMRLTNAAPVIADCAFQALAEIDDPAVVPPLVAALTHSNTFLHLAAATTLGQLRGKASAAVPPLENTLRSTDAGLRAAAARAIGFIGAGTDQTVVALITTLSDPDPRVRSAAAMALGALGTRAAAALPALRAMPEADDGFSRRPVARAIVRVQCEMRDGGLIRGPQSEKRIALLFAGHEFGEGGETILDALQKHNARAAFFLTGAFLHQPQFQALLERIVSAGHYIGPHSDEHLLYCSWERPPRTRVTATEFTTDLLVNVAKIQRRGFEPIRFRRYFLPPYEHYNREIADWTRAQRWQLINYTPGTRSHADYTGEADKNFTSSQTIFDSIVKREREDPHGLNGFLLLLHVGSGPIRQDKFSARFGELLDYLAHRGYEFVRVDELLEPSPNP